MAFSIPADADEASARPVVLITGGAGNIGTALVRALKADYRVISLDVKESDEAEFSETFDLTDPGSVRAVARRIAEEHGKKIAAVVHLAAYFDFTGEPSPLYEKVNVQGTRNLLEALDQLEVERFIYSSTMLVHQPGKPGQAINEDTPIQPQWAYPCSKAETEAVIIEYSDTIPVTLLRLAGLYDASHCVPTLAHQIARIFEATLKSHLYAGDPEAGQAFVHQDDMVDAFARCIERRHALPRDHAILIGEQSSESYQALQDRLGELIHGREHWQTLSVPKPFAKVGAWAEEKAEPVVPDDFDHGEKPFIRPFMIDMASDHYQLDTSRAREWLGWRPRHRLRDTLNALVDNLKRDPRAWYEANGITPPDWMRAAEEQDRNPEQVLERHQSNVVAEHNQFIWAHFFNMGLGAWLLGSPATLGYLGTTMGFSDQISGLLLMVLGFVSLSWRHSWARFACATVGVWLLLAPLLWWTANAAAYLNGTLVGMAAIGFSALVRPAPGVSPAAATSGPTVPPGWDNNPSSWFQRLPVVFLALLGLILSRYMAAYQLGHIDGVWEPLFAGTGASPLNGTEQIITSDVSEAWPVPDAGLGGMVYALEILLGLVGGTQRWRTMPWVVATFGLLIVPLGIVSIAFVIIQPILIGPLCTLCLIGALAMLLQIAYALNELVATGEFLHRRARRGAPVLKIFFTGDTDEGSDESARDCFQRAPLTIVRDMFSVGVSVPWNLLLAVAVGLWLMLTRLTLGTDGAMAQWNHLLGALVVTTGVIATAEVARPVRWLLIPLALPLLVTPFVFAAGMPATVASIVCAVLLIAAAVRRGPISGRYGRWSRLLR